MERHTIVEVTLTQGVIFAPFNQQSQLEGKTISSIAVFGDSAQYAPSGAALSATDNLYLVLRNSGSEETVNIPLSLIEYETGQPVLNFPPIQVSQVDWQKSGVKVSDGQQSTLTTGDVVMFIIRYA